MGMDDRLNLSDWLDFRAEHLEFQYTFGDQSDFAKLILDKLKSPLVTLNYSGKRQEQSWFEILADRLEHTCRNGDPEFAENYHYPVLAAFGKLNQVYSLLDSNADPRSVESEKARKLLGECIGELTKVFGHNEESWLDKALGSGLGTNRAQVELFPSLVNEYIESIDHGRKYNIGQIGFWLALDLLQQVYDKPLIEGVSLTIGCSAITPVLFWAEEEELGYVLWLKIELFKDYPGSFYPDLRNFGLTNISQLMEPMSQVWKAARIGDRFRGRWSITTRHPDGLQEFHQKAFHREDLGGASLQAAALAAVWAASGEIPLSTQGDDDKPEVYSLDNNRSLRLNPRVAISAQIIAAKDVHDDSIKLDGVGGIVGKINALRSYGTSRDQVSGVFDTVLVVSAETAEAREKFPKADEEKLNFSGIHLIDNCDTMADALFWMLEVNAWKKELNLWSEEKWQGQWGYARNADGHFLDKSEGKPIRFNAPDTNEQPTANGYTNWSDFLGCIIKVDDDKQEVTLELDPKNEKQNASKLAELLSQGLRVELERQVIKRGINTGSLEFMKNPVPGAVDDGRDPSAEISDQPKNFEGMPVNDDE